MSGPRFWVVRRASNTFSRGRRRVLCVAALVSPKPCSHCGQQIAWLQCRSGSVYPFWAQSFPAEQVALKDQYAPLVRAGEVWAVPLDGDKTRSGMVIMRHYCSAYAEYRLMRNVDPVGPIVDELTDALS
jgi:hypothetical protein